MSSFKYKPLDPTTNTFRLLRLFKGRRYYNDGHIRCEIYESLLPMENECDDTYEALSYTWGDPKHTKTILLNGLEVPVTINLHDALSHLRSAEMDRILWVDALCINQKNLSERTQQVDKMSFIYKKALRVIIWLGLTDTPTNLLLEMVNQLDRRIKRCAIPRNANCMEVWCNEGRRILSTMKEINPTFFEIRKQALRELLERKWFRRVWVVQEAANAASAVIQCSWISVSTKTFALMPLLMGLKVESRTQALLDVMPGPLRQNSWWNTHRDLGTVLQKFSQFESSDPRDQIYALLGLLVNYQTKGSFLRPDYQIELLEAIQKTVSFLAFGEVLRLKSGALPLWSLEELRKKLPSLKEKLFEWALSQNGNGIPVVQRLIHGDPRINVNDRLRTSGEYPLHFVISRRIPMRITKILLEREDLNINKSRDGMTPLDLAAKQGRVDVIEALRKRKDLKTIPQLRKAMAHAIDEDHRETIALLVSMAESLEDPSMNYMTSLLIQAAERGSLHTMSLLLKLRSSHNVKFHMETPLIAAIRSEHIAAVEMLIEKGANVNSSGPTLELPLAAAARSRNRDIVRVLMGAGADAHFPVPPGEESPLAIAAKNYDFGMIRMLESAGDHIKLPGTHSKDLSSPCTPDKLRILIRPGASVKLPSTHSKDLLSPSKPSKELLAESARNNDLETVRTLLSAGADVRSLEITDLMVSWRCMSLGNRMLPIMNFLIRQGIDINSKGSHRIFETPLIFAARFGDVRVVELLVKSGANVDEKGRQDHTALWYAVRGNRPEVSQLLINAGADSRVCKEFPKWSGMSKEQSKGFCGIIRNWAKLGNIG